MFGKYIIVCKVDVDKTIAVSVFVILVETSVDIETGIIFATSVTVENFFVTCVTIKGCNILKIFIKYKSFKKYFILGWFLH
jgi:hypothetical protein